MVQKPPTGGVPGGKKPGPGGKRRRVSIEARRAKEFLYRGYTVDELKALPTEEMVALMPARVRRNMKRGLSEEHQKLLARLGKTDEATVLRTHLRDMPILPLFVGRTVGIHNGKEFKNVKIEPDMLGHKLGEFAPTRGSVTHTGPGVGATRSSKFMPLK
ncbi:MAG: 30S ribosomal protein S19 [Methanobacteriota archaeon]